MKAHSLHVLRRKFEARALSADNPASREPYIILVDDARDARERTLDALERRYQPDYRIAAFSSPLAALEAAKHLAAEGDELAVILADQWMPELTGTELLTRVNEVFPLARRVLLIDWGA